MVVDTQLYEVLGVSPDADQSSIKKAFMKKAKELHPDKNRDDPEATEKFQRLNEAYEVLKDEEKRSKYDKYGLDGLKEGMGDHFDIFSQFFGGGHPFFGGGRSRGQERTPDVEFTLTVGLDDLYKGISKKIKVNRTVICNKCNGSGCKSGKSAAKCSGCNGTGQSVKIMKMGPMIQQQVGTCAQCRGTGEIIKNEDKCDTCKGSKTVKCDKIVAVEIPPGTMNGEKIKYTAMADEKPKAITGDLVVIIREKSHPLFKRNGDSLLVEKKISLSQALLGCVFDIVHLDGRRLIVKTKPKEIIKPDDFKVIENEGMPRRGQSFSKGKLYVHFTVEFPDYSTFSPDFKSSLEACIPIPKCEYNPDDENIHEIYLSSSKKEEFESRQNSRGRMNDDDSDDEGHHTGVNCQGQ